MATVAFCSFVCPSFGTAYRSQTSLIKPRSQREESDAGLTISMLVIDGASRDLFLRASEHMRFIKTDRDRCLTMCVNLLKSVCVTVEKESPSYILKSAMTFLLIISPALLMGLSILIRFDGMDYRYRLRFKSFSPAF